MTCDLSRFRSFLSSLYFAANLDPEAETCFSSSATWWFGASSGPWSHGLDDHFHVSSVIYSLVHNLDPGAYLCNLVALNFPRQFVV